MQFIFKDQITDKLLFVIQRVELALKRTSDVADCDDLLRTPEGVDLFDATCMRIQTIGETLKQISYFYPKIASCFPAFKSSWMR